MANTLVTFQEGKLALTDAGSSICGNPRVISVVGKGRRGKSTFMNALVSHLRNSNQTPFQTSDGDEHCTKSIDSYYFSDSNILLLDSKGLDYEDSRNDPALLLFLHQVSDVIIFNDRQRLDNSALKLLEPICTFSNYIDMDELTGADTKKPKLAFRIADCEIKDPAKAIQMLLANYADQYQSIRNTIRLLFDPDIQLIKTEQLDKAAKQLLEKGQYMEMLAQKEYGFEKAIVSILELAEHAAKDTTVPFRDLIATVVAKINGNKEISIEKLDVVKLSAETDIRRWERDCVPAVLFTPIEVDGTQACYERVVEPRKAEKKRILQSFSTRFRAVAEEIRTPFKEELSKRLADPILAATEESKVKARARVATVVQAAEKDHPIGTINSSNNSFTTIPEEFFTQFLHTFNTVKEACRSIYCTVRDEYTAWAESVCTHVMNTIAFIRKEEAAEKARAQQICDATFAGFFDAYLKSTKEYKEEEIRGLLKLTNRCIMEGHRNNVLNDVVHAINITDTRRFITFGIVNRKPTSNTIFAEKSSSIKDYDLVAPVIKDLLSKLNEYIATKESPLNVYLVKQKKDYLLCRVFTSADVLKNNPEIDFIKDNVATATCINIVDRVWCMTSDTHTQFFTPMYVIVSKKLAQKDMIPADKAMSGIQLISTVIQTSENLSEIHPSKQLTCYDRYIYEQWNHIFQKVYCREVMNGFSVPELTL